MIPQLAPVRPRVISPETGDAVLLTDAIEALLDRGVRRPIEIVGPPGSGKSTALTHLAATVGKRWPLALLDESNELSASAHNADCLVIFASGEGHGKNSSTTLHLAPWTDDELVEHLLAVSPDRCASVMRRLRGDEFRRHLDGCPELWRPVLDELGGDENIADARSALRRAFHRLLANPRVLPIAARYCLDLQVGRAKAAAKRRAKLESHNCPAVVMKLLRHRAMRVLLGADELMRLIEHSPYPYFTEPWPDVLIREFGRRVEHSPQAAQRLREFLASEVTQSHKIAASVLCEAGADWQPSPKMCLSGGRLNGAAWPGAFLPEIQLHGASLIGADLTRTNLQSANLRNCRLVKANLHRAWLVETQFASADLYLADLTAAHAMSALFTNAKLCSAKLDGANLSRADFSFADLSGASFAGADLSEASFLSAEIEEVEFRDANLHGSHFAGLTLRRVSFAGARLDYADLRECDLEFVRVPEANLERAKLTGAWLTASFLPGANLSFADLRNTGLADVEWEGADLRWADLRGCSFHMGSSRSGLVDSPYPGHGTRTGFYTDTYDDRYHKAPEEIRKANLCGVDLRGANIEGVDFYLVDLRGAKYDAKQAAHLRRCDAILEELV